MSRVTHRPILEGVTTVELRSDDRRDTFVRLSFPTPLTRDGFWVLEVEASSSGLSCSTGVVTYFGDGLWGYLRRLATDWRGWRGTRSWDTIEGEMSIEATHSGSRVELFFTIRRDFASAAWQVQVPIFLAPGESLSRLSEAVDQASAALRASS